MKILYIVWEGGCDYLSDTILIGLISNGHEVIDTHYRNYLGPLTNEELPNYYGKAFTLVNNLSPDREFIDRDNIKEKIASKYFDIVIYAHPYRCIDYFDIVLQFYSKEEIVFLDGEDSTWIHDDLTHKGIYFKREMVSNGFNTIPISFSFPKKKFFLDKTEKTQFCAFNRPDNRETYIFNDELSYYEDYRRSVYGFTMPKCGWDCMRHYEIVANGCLPYFQRYEAKPVYTMTNWPSMLQAEANYLYEHRNEASPDRLEKLTNEFLHYAYENLICEKISEQMLNRL